MTPRVSRTGRTKPEATAEPPQLFPLQLRRIHAAMPCGAMEIGRLSDATYGPPSDVPGETTRNRVGVPICPAKAYEPSADDFDVTLIHFFALAS